MSLVDIVEGSGPLVLGLPHCGTDLPDHLFRRLTPLGQTLGDTDWHVDRLYAGLRNDLTFVRANSHRYVVDVNRSPGDESLYPGQNTTGLVPQTDFDGRPLWTEGYQALVDDERMTFHTAYHEALRDQLARVRRIHGVAVLYDCHSIRSRIPYLFDGTLPDFNIGTNLSTTCAPEIEAAVEAVCSSAEGYSSVLNGRFKGGWTTRHYGQPLENIHAIQMELSQSTYLATERLPFAYSDAKAAQLRVHLNRILESIARVALTLGK